MSVIEAEVEVDETDIPDREDRPDGEDHGRRDHRQDVHGPGHRDRQQPDSDHRHSTASQATNFKVTLQVEGEIPDVRPGFTCTAEITTATRDNVLAVPIQATTVREMVLDEKGNIVREPTAPGRAAAPARRRSGGRAQARPGAQGSRRRLRGPRQQGACSSWSRPGIAGEKYFEVLSGLKDGDSVIVGPFSSVRTLADGAAGQGGTGAARDRRHPPQNELLPRISVDRPPGDLGEQASLVPDRAREHRRGDVDHRRGVADPGNERLRHRHHRVGRRRRQLHDPAHAGGAHARPTRSASATTRASR